MGLMARCASAFGNGLMLADRSVMTFYRVNVATTAELSFLSLKQGLCRPTMGIMTTETPFGIEHRPMGARL
jgi:hypothetical protein